MEKVAKVEAEEDPEVYEESSEEWSEGAEATPKKKGGKATQARKAPARAKKGKAKAPSSEEEDEEDDDFDEEEEDEAPKKKSKNGIKRAKLDDSETPKKKSGGGGGKGGTDFVNGGFLILKKDAQEGESKQPILWRIDGKVLLQKYEAFEEDGQTRHRNTNIYTGWSSSDKELYYPVTVKVLQHQGQNMTVELNWEKLKELCVDSE